MIQIMFAMVDMRPLCHDEGLFLYDQLGTAAGVEAAVAEVDEPVGGNADDVDEVNGEYPVQIPRNELRRDARRSSRR